MGNKLFEVLEGHPDKPHDEWEVVVEPTTKFPPEYLQEVYVRRFNWDQAYHGKQDGADVYYQQRRVLKAVPAERDWQTRWAASGLTALDLSVTPWGRNVDAFHCLHLMGDKDRVRYYKSISDACKDKWAEGTLAKFIRTYITSSDRMVDLIYESLGFSITEGFTFHTAITTEEICHVYAEGPNSCMSGDHEENQRNIKGYGPDPLIGVIYMMRGDMITARTLVNLETKQFVSIYGDSRRLGAHLREQGYIHSYQALNGRFIYPFKSEGGREYWPYLDGSHCQVETTDENGSPCYQLKDYGE